MSAVEQDAPDVWPRNRQEQVRRIIAHLKTLPPWDGKTYDEKLTAMLRELQPTIHGAGVSE